MDRSNCPICLSGELLTETGSSDHGNRYYYDCPTCGPFLVTRQCELYFRREMNIPLLSSWIREHKEFDRPFPEIIAENYKTIVSNLPNYTPSQKQQILLKAIERRTEHPGTEVSLGRNNDYPLAWASNNDEFEYYLNALEDRKLLTRKDVNRRQSDGSPPQSISTDVPYQVVITPEGWDYIDNQSLQPSFSDQAFIAMSFSDQYKEIYNNGIKPAVEDAGYKPVRVDMEPHIDRIDAKIINDIKNSKFIIADVTEQKQGVYFEAGFALGLGRPVIWSVREDDLENAHFDTRQYNHIVWKNADNLKEQLYNVICAVIGNNKKHDS
ncbi:hypothetical protein ACFL43_01780 [Thermodesulfobacteriota bacterium]